MEKTQVSLVECRDYNYDLVKKSVVKSFENLGGIEKYINKGETVLLKINLLMKKRPEEATTTHPAVVKALAEVIIEYGANVLIGDSPGGPFNERMLKGIYKVCGMEKVAEETGANLNYNTNEMTVKNDKGKILRNLTVTEMLKDVDKVISVSKLKTHGMATFTGAVKNMFGIIPGVLKAEYHLKMPDIKDFSDVLVDICEYANPVLSFMDGIVGMEGEGPSAGDPREVGVLISSTSPHHLDVVATSIINLKPTDVPTIQRSVERGLCKGNLDDVKLIGGSIEKFRIEDFKVPKTKSIDFISDILPKPVVNMLNSMLRPKPVFNYKDCVGCGDCAANCPPKVIEMVNNRPVVDLDGCIRCFCCQELCPKEAVTIRRPLLMRVLSKL
ncbi:DUF362 domain-containing protein [Caldisalinibacter kiritimatiensis]|uniref:Iron-sulfur cluster-binding protein n=1 Tax=Caldisalinibacter kiritimatiensis TaxID=1304284 RepID=R1CB89_9FIRM|nr:DUF362 domain-containing protein [Caldisalinibacter kiritimatiensis]EOC99574.1 Iron-sulfur cluster-binding protein [Caldisalinibacter kiritimatiensis]